MKDVTDTEFPITHDGKCELVHLIINSVSQSFVYACAKVAASRCNICHTPLLSELHNWRTARIAATVSNLLGTWTPHRAAATKIACNNGVWTGFKGT